jgi:hypothetical protein
MGQDDNHWCEVGFAEPAVVFKGPTQTARSVTEAWVALHGFQPNCAADRPDPHPSRYRHSGRRRAKRTGGPEPSGAREREAVAGAGA